MQNVAFGLLAQDLNVPRERETLQERPSKETERGETADGKGSGAAKGTKQRFQEGDKKNCKRGRKYTGQERNKEKVQERDK